MHELSIAMSLLDVATEEAGRLDANVIAVHLQLGPLSGVVREALESAYRLARENTCLSEAALVITEMPIIAWCDACQSEQTVQSPQNLCCPVCDTPAVEIRGGRELLITGLELLEAPDA